MTVITYRYKLKPTKAQHDRLKDALEHSRQLYNAALEERIDCYRKTGKGRSFFDQTAALTQLRQSDPVSRKYAWFMQSAPLKQLHLAYVAFFKRGGFPRFKGRDRFKCIAWSNCDGWKFQGNRFSAKGIGTIKVAAGRDMPGKAKTCRIKRIGEHWYLHLPVEVESTIAGNDDAIGIDMGIKTLAALSSGELIHNTRPNRRAAAEARRRARALARCNWGSKRRRKVRMRLAEWRRQEARSRHTYLHQISASLTKRFGVIAVENLNVKGLAASVLARDVNDASWGALIHMLRYKAERAGGQLIEVDPRHTSQTCPDCGLIKPKALSERVHSCPCGCVLDRDVAAAKVILQRAAPHRREVLNVAGYGERALGKAAANG